MKKILLTGGAGFIGSTLAELLLKSSACTITCIDNFDNFYDRAIKERNLATLMQNPHFKLVEGDLVQLPDFEDELDDYYDVIVHLAAKAGVRPSIMDPVAYQQVNYMGTLNLLEFARQQKIKQFVFASSSSVYGVNPNMPWSESDTGLQPISPYAASKVACELLGHTYSHLFNIRFIALRLFTVYGPRQRPDLAIHKFARLILQNKPITIYGDGSTQRDYTYVADIVAGIVAAMNYKGSDYEIINIGNNQTIKLIDLVHELEIAFNKKANLVFAPEQEGDVPATYANVNKGYQILRYKPRWDIKSGIKEFAKWMQTIEKTDNVPS